MAPRPKGFGRREREALVRHVAITLLLIFS